MTRTDHAAKARTLIQWVNEWQEDEGDTPETHLADALMAQAHATLALVEQQLIANLISLTNMDNINQLFDAGSEGLIAPNGLIRPDIAAALGTIQPDGGES